MNKNKHIDDWNKFLDSEEIKSNLVRASLYLFNYELLKNSIVDKIKDFYTIGFDENDITYSKDYNEKVVNRKINGKQNIFLSSLYWLQEAGAISKEDISEISAIRELRNTVAHHLDKILTDSDYSIDQEKENKIFEFIQKIELWWINEVEIPTNPDFDGKEIDHDNIVPGKITIYQYIKNVTDELLRKNEKEKN